jgi:hypothetical protein
MMRSNDLPSKLRRSSGAPDWLQLKSLFAEARHLSLPELVDDELCAALNREFPRSRDLAHRAIGELGRAYRRLDALLKSADFVAGLAALTGTPDLAHDDRYEHAGAFGVSSGRIHQWQVVPHSSGRRRRLGVLLNLTPEWTVAWDESAVVSPRALLFSAGDGGVQLTAHSSGAQPGRFIVAYYYTAAAEPILEHVAPPAPPTSLPVRAQWSAAPTVEPDAPPARLLEVLHAFERRGRWLDEQLRGEQQRSVRALLELVRLTDDGSAPLTTEELERVRALFAQQDVQRFFIQALARSETRAPALPRLRATGPAKIERHEGAWRDGWVSSRWTIHFCAEAPLSSLRIRGLSPKALANRQTLTAQIGTTRLTVQPVGESFELLLPLTLARGERAGLEVAAGCDWNPLASGASADSRSLAWHLLSLTFA